MAISLKDLVDVNDDDKQNTYLLSYKKSSDTWKSVNPDEILSAATTEPIQPELPQDFTDELNSTLVPELSTDLDNQIDVDAGTF
jgi:hypothetical protein